MNIPDNKRKRDSQERIERVFIKLLQTKELNEISVTDICKITKLNRSTFYANYLDVYDLADKVKEKLEMDVASLYQDEINSEFYNHDFLRLFKHIKDNQLFYSTYFKLGYDNDHKVRNYDVLMAKEYFDDNFIDYHIEFFKSGFNAIIKLWLKNGCRETPEEINSILLNEYKHRKKD